MGIMIDSTRGHRPWSVRQALRGQFRARSGSLFEANQGAPATRNAAEDRHLESLEYDLSGRFRTLFKPGLGASRAHTYARAVLGLVVAVGAFAAGNVAHAHPGQESSPKSTARAADGGYRIVEFSRPLPRAPLPAAVESEPVAAAPRILAVSFSAGSGPVRWYPPRRSIEVTVKFNRAVTVDTAGGTPRIDLVLGTRLLRRARYASGSGSAELIFRYGTGDWNQALSDIAVGASSLRLNGGRIDSLDSATAADLAHAAGRLDNVGARPDSAANDFLVAVSGNGAGANPVALPPAVLRTPLPSLNPDDALARSRRGHGVVAGQEIAPLVSGAPGRRAGVGHGAGAAPGSGTAARPVLVPAGHLGQPVGGPPHDRHRGRVRRVAA